MSYTFVADVSPNNWSGVGCGIYDSDACHWTLFPYLNCLIGLQWRGCALYFVLIGMDSSFTPSSGSSSLGSFFQLLLRKHAELAFTMAIGMFGNYHTSKER